MFKIVKDHSKVLWGILIAIMVFTILGVWQKMQYKANPYEKQIGNPPREEKALNDTFYLDQLSEKERQAYFKIKKAIQTFSGGEVVFPVSLTGLEYARVAQALECGEDDFFYAIVEIPMTEKNQNAGYISNNITDIKDSVITKCMLLLYPAQGINENGDIDKEGFVKNLEQLKMPLSTMNKKKLKTVEEMRKRTEEILDKVVNDMPKEYGKKEAIDYFLNWMDNYLDLDEDMMQSTESVSNMTEAFERVYFKNHCSSVVEKKAMAAGYSKVLTKLCNKSGILAHIVLGRWKNSESYTLVYVNFDGKPVYIDASGYKSGDLWDQRYISDTLVKKNMTMPKLFD